MLPQSARSCSSTAERGLVQEAISSLRPANITFKTSAETRALLRWLACCGVLGVIAALGAVSLRLQVVDLGYRLSAARALIQKLEREQRELSAEVATLSAPARIGEIARLRLGMAPPGKSQEVVLP